MNNWTNRHCNLEHKINEINQSILVINNIAALLRYYKVSK